MNTRATLSAPTRVRRFLLVAVVAVALGVGAALPAGAASEQPPGATPGRDVTVLSRNLYLGADVFTLFGAQTPEELATRATAVWQQVLATDFASRAEALADEVAETQPDVLALQEVALWRTDTPADGRATPATHVAQDFLAILRGELAARGLHYRTRTVQQNFDGEAPTVLGFDVRLTDRDVILTRADRPALKVRGTGHGRFAAALPVPVLPGQSVDVVRGWTSVDVKVRGRSARVFNSHLETDASPASAAVQVAQGQELLALADASPLPTVVAGDLNSRADGTGTPTYGQFRNAGFDDVWSDTRPGEPGFTCCQTPSLTNPESALSERIDVALHRGAVTSVRSDLVGEQPADRTPGGLWPSDHAGLVATVRLG